MLQEETPLQVRSLLCLQCQVHPVTGGDTPAGPQSPVTWSRYMVLLQEETPLQVQSLLLQEETPLWVRSLLHLQ